jgi:molecular chaperone GrpE (heat shock protein)
MSAFDSTENQQNAENNSENEGNQSYVAKIVAARGEKWSDPEMIAKGKLEADAYITNLERQLQELKEDLTKTKSEQDYAKQLLETIQNGKLPSASGGEDSPKEDTSTQTEDTTLDPSKLEELIAQTLDKRTAAQRAQDNLNKVDSRLNESYGTDAQNAVQAKAQELGLSVDYMKSIAEQSPDAFFSLMGSPKPAQSASPPKGSVNSEAHFKPGERNYAYYAKIRKENPVAYYSPETQRQMFADAKAAKQKGIDFYSN